jgi:hypothetical protein
MLGGEFVKREKSCSYMLAAGSAGCFHRRFLAGFDILIDYVEVSD